MKDKIENLIKEELERSNRKFPQFASTHEAFGVMSEELHEAMNEFEDVIEGITIDYFEAMVDNQCTEDILKILKVAVVRAIEELVQVGAMVDKAKVLEDKKEKEVNNE